MDFGKAFTYPFEDPDWARKILIPALIALIPLVGVIFIIGWALDITRRVIRQDPTPLPDLDFGRQLSDGLKGFVVNLVYLLPAILLMSPVWILTALSGNMDENTAGLLLSLFSVCCGGLVVLYFLFVSFVIQAAYANMVAHDELRAAFRFNQVVGLLRAAPGAWLLALLGTLVCSAFIAPLGAIACIIGGLATFTYSWAVIGHLYGQGYVESTRNRGLGNSYGTSTSV